MRGRKKMIKKERNKERKKNTEPYERQKEKYTKKNET